MDLRLKALLAGVSTYIPGYDHKRFTGGTDSPRYCYSVWLRHLTLAARHSAFRSVPRVVAELGPGDSVGIGLAALLAGAEKYYALDLVRYSDLKKNLEIFDELVRMFRARSPIPDDSEFPFLFPKLSRYEFPQALLGESSLAESLAPARVQTIRNSVELAASANSMVCYKAPWNAPDIIDDASVDLMFSQAVLEHVDDLEGVYAAMRRWLKPGGMMTHQIDFKSHGKANAWNGHWSYPDPVWKIIVGRRPYLLNRLPHSAHLKLMQRCGFRILEDAVVRTPSELRTEQLAARFRGLSEDDLTVSGAFIVADIARGV